jgi:hypothetical protein
LERQSIAFPRRIAKKVRSCLNTGKKPQQVDEEEEEEEEEDSEEEEEEEEKKSAQAIAGSKQISIKDIDWSQEEQQTGFKRV